jgi:hypothetical protein
MHADQLANHAIELVNFLKSTGHPEVTCEHSPNAGRFIDVFKAPLPRGAGIYLFQFDNGEVFYIGKTEAERGDFARIWSHLRTAARILDSGQRGFPESEFLAAFEATSKEYEAIRPGHFKIDYLIVAPALLTSLFEVYLQTICALSKEGLPKCNIRIG